MKQDGGRRVALNSRGVVLSRCAAALAACLTLSVAYAGELDDFDLEGLGTPLGLEQPAAPAIPDWVMALPEQVELHDLFRKPDGTRIRTQAEWAAQRAYWIHQLMYYKYGRLPAGADVVVDEVKTEGKTDGNQKVALPEPLHNPGLTGELDDMELAEPKHETRAPPEIDAWPVRECEGAEGRVVQLVVRREGARDAKNASESDDGPGNERTSPMKKGNDEPLKQITFKAQIFRPVGKAGPLPVILLPRNVRIGKGDRDIRDICGKGFLCVAFGADEFTVGSQMNRGLKVLFPEAEYDCGDYASRAWGYMRMIDYLVEQDYVDAKRIAVFGFSKYGASSLIAGILDARVALIMTGGSNVGGTQPIRSYLPLMVDGQPHKNGYWYWCSERWNTVSCDRPKRTPVDSHVAVALCAPRPIILADGTNDSYVGTKGVQQSYTAAREVYRFLGVPENLGIVFRPGGHSPNMAAFIDFTTVHFNGAQPARDYQTLPYPDLKPMFGWTAPKGE